MKACFSLLLLIGLTPQLIAAFSKAAASQAYEQAAVAFAHHAELPSFATAEVGDFILGEGRWEVAEESDEEEANELHNRRRLIESYILPDRAAQLPPNSPFGPTLTNWMTPEPTYCLDGCAVCTLVDQTEADVRRVVWAMEAPPLRAERQRILAFYQKVRARTEAEWIAELRQVAQRFQHENRRSQFLTLLKCPIVNLIEQGDMGPVLKDGEVACQELTHWREALMRDDAFFAQHPALCAWRITPGPFFPQWRQTDGGRLQEAKRLFAQGKSLDRILSLLIESIEQNPISAEKWGYLGGTLREKGLYAEAVYAYAQALRYDVSLTWAWTGLRESCDKAGLKQNAEGLRWFLAIGR